MIIPATVKVVLQLWTTEPLSKKKNNVAANIPIEVIQNETPTKSSEDNKAEFAFAVLDKNNKTTVDKVKSLRFFIQAEIWEMLCSLQKI